MAVYFHILIKSQCVVRVYQDVQACLAQHTALPSPPICYKCHSFQSCGEEEEEEVAERRRWEQRV